MIIFPNGSRCPWAPLRKTLRSEGSRAEVDEDTGGLAMRTLLRWKPEQQILASKNGHGPE
jgi:hypothetical protein